MAPGDVGSILDLPNSTVRAPLDVERGRTRRVVGRAMSAAMSGLGHRGLPGRSMRLKAVWRLPPIGVFCHCLPDATSPLHQRGASAVGSEVSIDVA